MSLPSPALEDFNRAFWTGGHSGDLLISRCADCSKYSHPPTPRCGYCHSDHVAPQPVSGRGTIYSYTVNRQAWQPDLEVPYVIAIVELDEQSDLRLMTNIIGSEVEDVAIGQPVEVVFQDRGEVSVPVFRAAVA
ncbi:Zn-ribbon domain-containing OB-fold protein [Citricoccus nitrophenolicus]